MVRRYVSACVLAAGSWPLAAAPCLPREAGGGRRRRHRHEGCCVSRHVSGGVLSCASGDGAALRLAPVPAPPRGKVPGFCVAVRGPGRLRRQRVAAAPREIRQAAAERGAARAARLERQVRPAAQAGMAGQAALRSPAQCTHAFPRTAHWPAGGHELRTRGRGDAGDVHGARGSGGGRASGTACCGPAHVCSHRALAVAATVVAARGQINLAYRFLEQKRRVDFGSYEAAHRLRLRQEQDETDRRQARATRKTDKVRWAGGGCGAHPFRPRCLASHACPCRTQCGKGKGGGCGFAGSGCGERQRAYVCATPSTGGEPRGNNCAAPKRQRDNVSGTIARWRAVQVDRAFKALEPDIARTIDQVCSGLRAGAGVKMFVSSLCPSPGERRLALVAAAAVQPRMPCTVPALS